MFFEADIDSGEEVAVKVLRETAAQDTAALDEPMREIEILEKRP